jgi:hypothetical protein
MTYVHLERLVFGQSGARGLGELSTIAVGLEFVVVDSGFKFKRD